MTIAACYLSPEGVVLGADSMSTYPFPGHDHHFNYGQKLFEIGEDSTFGLVTWGLGDSLWAVIARLSLGWPTVSRALPLRACWKSLHVGPRKFGPPIPLSLASQIALCQLLAAKPPFVPNAAPPAPGARTAGEEAQFIRLKRQLVVGFCVGGYAPQDRTPAAFEIVLDPLQGPPTPNQLPPAQSFWGVPALTTRLIKGCADEIREAILNSGRWTGSPADLDALMIPHRLYHPETVPIREAVDFTLTTVKALKFSQNSRVCGGPIELAVVTTDRLFRWVRHKSWDAAIRESDA